VSGVLADVSWPPARLGDALAALGASGGEPPGPPPAHLARAEGGQLGRWIEATAGALGLEAEPVETPHGEVRRFLAGAGPALLCLPDQAGPRFLVLLGSTRRGLALLTPELTRVYRPAGKVRAALCRDVEAPVAGEVERALGLTGVRGRRWQRAREALLGELLADSRVGGCWLLRTPGAAGLPAQAREAGLPRLLAALVGAHTVQIGLYVLSWWLLGWLTLHGRLDPGWLAAWLLLLAALVPCRMLATAAGGTLSVRAGALLKRRLLAGALKLEPDDVRHLGVGQLLGRVLESDAVAALALAGGLLVVQASVQVLLAALVLSAGAGGRLHLALLLGVTAALVLLTRRYLRLWRRWTAQRLDLTNDLVERLAGHRTRLAQEPRACWGEGEDQALERYLRASAGLDRTGALLLVGVPRGWLLLGLLGLAPALVAGGRGPAALAVAVGGILLSYQALHTLAESLDRLVAAAVAWERLQLFWQAAARPERGGRPEFAVTPAEAGRDGPAAGPPVLDVRDVVFRHRDRAAPVLRGVSLCVGRGDRVLLEGPSGGGKSTLAALLAGQRLPAAGLVLLGGLDRDTLGAGGWRRRVLLAPPFHDNHVLMGTLAFNALLGRGWPPRPADLEEAERVCRALDLGPLLDRMPGGVHQLVGETGWQLSHGEKSRLYVARAVLQGAELIVLDESLAALDPQTLRHTLAFVLQRATTLVVIAHP
jgi:ATP-binding cassette subfamily B protein